MDIDHKRIFLLHLRS